MPQRTLLLVADQKNIVKKTTGVIQSDFPEFVLQHVTTGAEALESIYYSPPALIMVHAALPDICGIQICRALKHDPVIRKLPVLFITKDTLEEYQRFNELSLVADVFIGEKAPAEDYTKALHMLVNLYRGLDAAELEQLTLLRQETVNVKAVCRVVQLLDQAMTEVQVMKGFNQLMEYIPQKNVLHHFLFSMLETVLDYDVAGIFFNDKSRESRLMTYHLPKNFLIKDDQLKDWTERIFARLQSQSNESWLFNATHYETITPDFQTPGKAVTLKHESVYPFFIEDNLIGGLVFLNRQEMNYDIIFPFPLVLSELSSLMRLRRYYSEAEVSAISDPLTGLYGHQHFTACLEREIRQAKRHREPLTLAHVSLNNFHELNIQWGYEQVDKAFTRVAQMLLQNVRNIDLLSRAGSRTIVALFPKTTSEASSIALKRIQTLVSETPVALEDGQTIPISISIGLATFSEDIQSASEFMAQAQKAVEQARMKGSDALEVLQ